MKRVVVISGAGISAESGLKTFRGTDGLWRGYRPEEVACPEAWRRLRRSCAFPLVPVATARLPDRLSLKSREIRWLDEPGTGTPPVREPGLFLLHRYASPGCPAAPRPSRPPPLIAKKSRPRVGAALWLTAAPLPRREPQIPATTISKSQSAPVAGL